MVTSGDRRRESAERKVKSQMNNSYSKALYTFSKAQRFPNKRHQSMINVHCYNVQPKLYNKKITFTLSKRVQLKAANKNPGPYGKQKDFSVQKRTISTDDAMQECKANSIFKKNENPGPGQYSPNCDKKFKTLHYSLGKKVGETSRGKTETPGPIYMIQSTMLDKNKHLSIYIRRNSTKICGRASFPRKRKDENNTIPLSKQLRMQTESAIVTCKGRRRVGQEGPFTILSHQMRPFQKTRANRSPGPGSYPSFSQFIDDDDVLI